jgi:hypothetical protein
MLNSNQFKEYIEKIFKINAFNLSEYQDKFYFKKKILEKAPEFTESEIYSTISNLNREKLSKKDKFIGKLTSNLYAIYLTKGNDTTSR